MTSTELPFNGLTGYIMLTTLVIALGYQVAMQILNSTSDSRIITDDQLTLIVNYLGSVVFILIIIHHSWEAGQSKSVL